MSHHPLKKSEMNTNDWYRKSRNGRVIEAPQRHLILCEGEQTEPNYFDGMANKINSKHRGRVSIEVQDTGEGRLKLLETAQEVVKKYVDISHVWLVFDKDDFPKDEFDNTVHKVKTLNKKSKIKYHVLWSNQCIEFWFLLHFIDLKTDIDRKEYINKLNIEFKKHKIVGKYAKNDTQILDKLLPYYKIAIDRADKIITENKGKAPSQIKPGTNVYEILLMLGKYFE